VASAPIGPNNGAESHRRDILVGLERTRIVVLFIGQLLNEAGDVRAMLRIDAVLRRLDGMITQFVEARRMRSSSPLRQCAMRRRQ
jgi:hypothetical protein